MKLFIYDEIKFVVGNNAIENWDILMNAKKENQKYVWLHLEHNSSPYVIIKKELSKCSSLDINHGAKLCKQYSKHKNVSYVKIMYTSVDKVIKGNKIGEVYVKGKYQTVKI